MQDEKDTFIRCSYENSFANVWAGNALKERGKETKIGRNNTSVLMFNKFYLNLTPLVQN